MSLIVTEEAAIALIDENLCHNKSKCNHIMTAVQTDSMTDRWNKFLKFVIMINKYASLISPCFPVI